jgi:hypothetical protein
MRVATFIIDAMPGHVFNGFTIGNMWNGWARPFFTYDEAQRIVAAHKEQGLNAYYDHESDGFAFEVSCPSGDYDLFHKMEIASMRLYPVGSGNWIWEEAVEECQAI